MLWFWSRLPGGTPETHSLELYVVVLLLFLILRYMQFSPPHLWKQQSTFRQILPLAPNPVFASGFNNM